MNGPAKATEFGSREHRFGRAFPRAHGGRSDDLVLSRSGLWFRKRRFPCTIGRGGVVEDKREGDGGTPSGIHRIVGMLYRADRVARPAPLARTIRPGDCWCDDAGHPAYNHMVRAPFGASHERLWRSDRLYDLVLLTDWNWPDARPGSGSAIFVHRWRRKGCPTEGCIALRPDHLAWIARDLPIGTRLIVPPRA